MTQTQTQRGEAWQLIYGRKWKFGDMPDKRKLGEMQFPIDAGIEDMDLALSRAFPDATDSRLFDERGYLFCSGTLR